MSGYRRARKVFVHEHNPEQHHDHHDADDAHDDHDDDQQHHDHLCAS